MPRISPARKAAFQILLALQRSDQPGIDPSNQPGIERSAAHSGDLLRGESVNALAAADRNLATTLVLGVLRWQLRLDQQIRKHLAKPNARLDAEVLIALRLGAFQLLHLDRVPAHAAVGESVELARQSGHRYSSGMVNAVLRKLAAGRMEVQEQTAEKTTALKGHDFSRAVNGLKTYPALAAEGRLLGSFPLTTASSAASLSPEVAAHPAWMTERWRNFYGTEAACAICRHGQTQPRISLRIQEPGAEFELSQAGIQLAPGELLTVARTVIAGDVTATAAFREGRVRIQDEGSQLVAELAAASMPQGSVEDKKGAQKILDACAAPGGKTLILAERHPEARIAACEASPRRLELLRTRLAAHSDRIETRLADASSLTEEAVFDLVLADVPCSGTGTLGRNPEIRHRLTVDDLSGQAERQRAILRAALRAVRPAGCVVYSTCSLEPEENGQVVAAVLEETPGAHKVSLAPRIDSLHNDGILTPSGAELLRNCITPESALRLLPGAVQTDGFFAALIEKTG